MRGCRAAQPAERGGGGSGRYLFLKLLLAPVQEKPSEVLLLAIVLKLGTSRLHFEAELGVHFAELRLCERLVEDLRGLTRARHPASAQATFGLLWVGGGGGGGAHLVDNLVQHADIGYLAQQAN